MEDPVAIGMPQLRVRLPMTLLVRAGDRSPDPAVPMAASDKRLLGLSDPLDPISIRHAEVMLAEVPAHGAQVDGYTVR
jgi:hypothetical protein